MKRYLIVLGSLALATEACNSPADPANGAADNATLDDITITDEPVNDVVNVGEETGGNELSDNAASIAQNSQ